MIQEVRFTSPEIAREFMEQNLWAAMSDAQISEFSKRINESGVQFWIVKTSNGFASVVTENNGGVLFVHGYQGCDCIETLRRVLPVLNRKGLCVQALTRQPAMLRLMRRGGMHPLRVN